jgi:outer membrane protein W
MTVVNIGRIVFVVIVFCVTLNGAAVAGDLSVGAKAGFNFSNISNTPSYWEPYKDYKTGFTGGLVLLYEFNDQLAIQPELLYSQKGVQSNLYEGIILVDVTASFNYVELPILLRYQVPLKGKFKPFVFAGPCISYSLSSELELSASILSVTLDIGSLSHVSDFGLVAGGGFGYEVGNGLLVLDARVYYGFTNVLLTGDFEINGSIHTIEEDDFKNYGFVFMLGYII